MSENALRLALISHAPTGATRASLFPLDEPLEPKSYANAVALAGALGRIDRAWTSPARRARQTAEALGFDAAVETALSDIDLGRWAGKSLADVEALDLAGLRRWMEDPAAAPHGGESIECLMRRISEWLRSLENDARRIVVVTHAAVIRAATVVLLQANARSFWRIDVAPLRASTFHFHNRLWTIRTLNEPLCPPHCGGVSRD